MYRTMLSSPVFGLRREIDRLFEDTFANGGERSSWAPPVNIKESPNAFQFGITPSMSSPRAVSTTVRSIGHWKKKCPSRPIMPNVAAAVGTSGGFQANSRW